MSLKEKERFRNWSAHNELEREEKDRITFLNGPLPKNDPSLFEMVEVKVLKPFFVLRVRMETGFVVQLPRHLALEMEAIGKVEIHSK